jgi:predicted nucleic acid-binding protein
MVRPIAVVDTDVILLLLDTEDEKDVRVRKSYAELTIENLERQKARFVVPAPVIAELCGNGPGSDVVREVAEKVFKNLRIEVLDEDAAVIAGEMSRTRLKQRQGRERGAVKVDCQIAGIAHRIGAKWLVTGNGEDYRKCFAVLNSPVEVIDATQQPAFGQQVMVSLVKPATAGK